MASVTVSGTLTINIEGLEEEMQKIEALKSKISATIRKMLERVTKVASADNWPDIQEGSEQLKKIYQAALNRIESKSDRIKAEINKVLDQIKQNESKVQSKFGELLVKAGQAVKGETKTIGATLNKKAIQEKINRYSQLTEEDLKEISKMSYKDKVEWLDNYNKNVETYGPGGSLTDFQKIDAIKESFTPLQKTMYDMHTKTNDFNRNLKVKSNNALGSLKNLFSGKKSVLTDIKESSNDKFLKLFGNRK